MRRDADFAAWARQETPALLRRAVLLCGELQQAEDLMQETLIRIYLHWARLDDEGNPVAYAHTTLFHVFVSTRRRRSSTERPTAELPDHPEGDRTAADLRLDLGRALTVLHPRERCVVVARYLDDRSVAEVAQMLGRTQAWVRTTSHRALRRLRDCPALLAVVG